MKPEILNLDDQAILYDGDRLAHPLTDLFDPGWLSRHQRIEGHALGRGQAYFVRLDGVGACVLRHYRRGGMLGALLHDRYLYTGLARSRAFAEWRLLARLHGLGLPVPAPIAARVQRQGLCYRADLITLRIEGSASLAQRLSEAHATTVDWRAIGACVRRFHDAGVFHADLNARNILIDEAGQVSLIDFDKGRVRPTGAWQQANLDRLLRSLRKLVASGEIGWQEHRCWAELLAAYRAR